MRILKDKIKYIVTIFISAALVFGLGGWFLFKTPSTYSEAERRALKLLPEFSFESVFSGEFMAEFDDNSPDQFPLRDLFRSIKAYTAKYVFGRLENNNIITAGDHLSKHDYVINENKIDEAADKIGFIYESYLSNTDAKVYLSVVPDKNCFIAEENGFLAYDYDEFAKKLYTKTPFATYVDVKPLLGAEDYYTTDTHWKQENIIDVAHKLCTSMGAEFDDTFKENIVEQPFYGVYYHQSALSVPTDKLIYLTSDIIDGAVVTNFDSGMPVKKPVYDMKKLDTPDIYEIFLSGTVALSVIENPAATEKRELILFRDSFGSSIAPLMINSYSKITLVDIRYVSPSILSQLVDFGSADDVLFLYSTVFLNSFVALD